MSNTPALIIGAFILVSVGLDFVLTGGTNVLFLGRKLFVLIDWLAFWR